MFSHTLLSYCVLAETRTGILTLQSLLHCTAFLEDLKQELLKCTGFET